MLLNLTWFCQIAQHPTVIVSNFCSNFLTYCLLFPSCFIS